MFHDLVVLILVIFSNLLISTAHHNRNDTKKRETSGFIPGFSSLYVRGSGQDIEPQTALDDCSSDASVPDAWHCIEATCHFCVND